jgi:hypothetical protein
VFVLVTDASAQLVVLQQTVNGSLARCLITLGFFSVAEGKYSTYEKECLALIFGCENCRTYLEHKDFELRCDILALCWHLKGVKDEGRIGRWILRLSPSKFNLNKCEAWIMWWLMHFLECLREQAVKPLRCYVRPFSNRSSGLSYLVERQGKMTFVET